MKRAICLFLSFLFLSSLCSCAKSTSEKSPSGTVQDGGTENSETVITDAIGREVSIVPGSYKRIVCIGAGALRMYTYVCGSDNLCGVEDIDNETLSVRPQMFDSVARPYVLAFGDSFSVLPSCGVGGPQAQTAESEKILSCNPDIVISEYEDADRENALQEQLGVPVITLSTGPDGIFDGRFGASITLLGTIFGKESRAEELIRYVDSQSAEISSRVSTISDTVKPSVYICGLGNWGTTDYLSTSANYYPFKLCNIKNALTDIDEKGVVKIEKEKFLSISDDIDIMIVDCAAVKNIIPLYSEDSTIFDTVKAWQDGNVYLQMAYNAYYTNFETDLINTWFIAKCVYPELFEDINIYEKSAEITTAFLGTDLTDAIKNCPMSYGGYSKIDTITFFQP